MAPRSGAMVDVAMAIEGGTAAAAHVGCCVLWLCVGAGLWLCSYQIWFWSGFGFAVARFGFGRCEASFLTL